MAWEPVGDITGPSGPSGIGPSRVVSGATDTPTSADIGGTLHFTSDDPITVTLNTGVLTATSQRIDWAVEGEGVPTFVAGTATVVCEPDLTLVARGQYSAGSIMRLSDGTLLVIGSLVEA